MKTNQITIITITITAVLLFALVGCEEPKGYLELKEPKKELVDREMNWSVTHGLTDSSGNPVAPEEAE